MRAIELVAKLERSHADWLSFLESIPDETAIAPGAVGEWSVKDVVAHIAFYEWWLAEFITAKTWPIVPEGMNTEDWDVRNRIYYLQERNTPLAEIRDKERHSHAALVTAIAGLSDAQIADQSLLGMPAGPGWSIPELLASSSWEHYEEHRATIQAWLRAGDELEPRRTQESGD